MEEVEKKRGGGKCIVLVTGQTEFSCKLNLLSKVIPDKKTTSLSLFAFI